MNIVRLVEAFGRRHGSLDNKATNVLPSLLQQRDKVVDSQHDVGDQLVFTHTNIANSDTQAEDLLQLEFDSRFDFGDLAVHILIVRDGGREFTS